MSDGTFRLSLWQLTVLVFAVSLCVTVFAFPGVLDRQLGRASWLAILPAIGAGLWGTLAAAGIARRFPGQPFDRTVRQLLGPTAGWLYLAALALLMVGGGGGNLQVFAGLSGTTELTRLPPVYPALLTGAVGAVAAYYGPEVVARTGEIAAPIIGVGLLVIYAPLSVSAHFGRLMPLAGVPLDTFLAPTVVPVAGAVRGFLALLIIGPFCRGELRAGPLCAATAAAGLLIGGSLALPMALFGAPFAATLRYPFVTAVGTITWQWLPVHHLVVVTMLVWNALVSVVFATYLWMGAWLCCRLVRGLPWTPTLLALAVVEIAAASLPLSSAVSHGFLDVWNDVVVILGLVVPTLLWAMASRRAASERLRAAG